MAVCDAIGGLATAAVAAAPTPVQKDDALLDDAAAVAVEDGLSQVAQAAVMFGAAPGAARAFEQREQPPLAGHRSHSSPPPVCLVWKINAEIYTGV